MSELEDTQIHVSTEMMFLFSDWKTHVFAIEL